jgi:hypothetical protein
LKSLVFQTHHVLDSFKVKYYAKQSFMTHHHLFFILTMVIQSIITVSALAAEPKAPTFRAGVAAIDISPTEFPRIIAGGFLEGRGEKQADKLFVRSFVLDDG